MTLPAETRHARYRAAKHSPFACSVGNGGLSLGSNDTEESQTADRDVDALISSFALIDKPFRSQPCHNTGWLPGFQLHYTTWAVFVKMLYQKYLIILIITGPPASVAAFQQS